jgi:hypothetical protein
MRADNSHHIVQAARRRRELTRAKAIQALRTLDAAGEPVTFETVRTASARSRSPAMSTAVEQTLRPANRTRSRTMRLSTPFWLRWGFHWK